MNIDGSNGKVKQHIKRELRYSMRDFNNEFPNDSACLDYIAAQRLPEGMGMCPACNVERKHHRVGNRTAYACDHCGHHFYPLTGTIFEKSSTSLKTWFYAMYLMGSTRCGISAKQVQRETGVTYKTAWRMFNQIRTLLSDGDLQLEGPTVEVDEMYHGGVRKYGTGRPMRGDKKKNSGYRHRSASRIGSRQGRKRREGLHIAKADSQTRRARKHHLH
jgi:transposase